jgi:hypothetical protein
MKWLMGVVGWKKRKKEHKKSWQKATDTRGIERGILVFDRFLLEL